jgi:hypothetical protein
LLLLPGEVERLDPELDLEPLELDPPELLRLGLDELRLGVDELRLELDELRLEPPELRLLELRDEDEE